MTARAIRRRLGPELIVDPIAGPLSLRPGQQAPRGEVKKELNRTVHGWANDFRDGARPQTHWAVDRYGAERGRHARV